MTLIQGYLKGLLAPRLRTYGLNKEQRAVICNDVEQRLASLLFHWHDQPFRQTILTLANEEASFWTPDDVALAIRSLVVLCVRNSLIEGLNSATRAQRQILPDEDMPALTGEAIAHFRNLDIGDKFSAPATDLFGSLPRRFPNAWQCLSVLAQSKEDEASYSLVLEKAEGVEAASSRSRKLGGPAFAADGMDTGVDPALRNVLLQIQKGELKVFLAPSFSRITRNPVKLLSIVDHVLRHNAALVTCNYMLSGTYVARRNPFIRPAHTESQANANLLNYAGLSSRHKQYFVVAE